MKRIKLLPEELKLVDNQRNHEVALGVLSGQIRQTHDTLWKAIELNYGDRKDPKNTARYIDNETGELVLPCWREDTQPADPSAT